MRLKCPGASLAPAGKSVENDLLSPCAVKETAGFINSMTRLGNSECIRKRNSMCRVGVERLSINCNGRGMPACSGTSSLAAALQRARRTKAQACALQRQISGLSSRKPLRYYEAVYRRIFLK